MYRSKELRDTEVQRYPVSPTLLCPEADCNEGLSWRMPHFPSRRLSQLACIPFARGETAPRPVTTTRLWEIVAGGGSSRAIFPRSATSAALGLLSACALCRLRSPCRLRAPCANLRNIRFAIDKQARICKPPQQPTPAPLLICCPPSPSDIHIQCCQATAASSSTARAPSTLTDTAWRVPPTHTPITMANRNVQAKNRAPASIQITAEQILREAKDRQLDVEVKAPRQQITDEEELRVFRMRKRKEVRVVCFPLH